MQLARTLLVTLTILATSALGAETNMKTDTAALASDNPLARESTLPFQLPPFDKITDAHIGPALDAGMAQQRKEIDRTATDVILREPGALPVAFEVLDARDLEERALGRKPARNRFAAPPRFPLEVREL